MTVSEKISRCAVLKVPRISNMVKNRRYEDESSGYGIRHLQILFLFLALSAGFATRVNLSVAIVAMTELPEYKWSEQVKSLVLSSFFWGYVFPQLPSGPLARRFGGKVMILTGLAISSVLTVLTPFFASYGGWQWICGIRLVMGVSQGILFPSVHTVISAWVTPKERASMSNFSYAGNQFGTILMLAVSGLLISFGGWPCVFYASGGLGCIFSVAYYIWGASTPADSKQISLEEREYIELQQNGEQAGNVEKPKQQPSIPWSRIITSPAVLALIVVQSAYVFGFWMLLTQIPSYIKNVLGKDIKSNALLSALPYTVMLVVSFGFAWLSRRMQTSKSISLNFNRKFFNSIGFMVPMILLIALGYVRNDQDTLAIIILVFTVSVSSAGHVGFLVNHIDMSPNYAGIIMGICNTFANGMALIAPLLVGAIVTDNSDAHQWRIVFFVAAAIYFIGNTVFIIFGRTNVQSWNDPEYSAPRVESQS